MHVAPPTRCRRGPAISCVTAASEAYLERCNDAPFYIHRLKRTCSLVPRNYYKYRRITQVIKSRHCAWPSCVECALLQILDHVWPASELIQGSTCNKKNWLTNVEAGASESDFIARMAWARVCPNNFLLILILDKLPMYFVHCVIICQN